MKKLEMNEEVKVVILGAGLSGLWTALTPGNLVFMAISLSSKQGTLVVDVFIYMARRRTFLWVPNGPVVGS